MTDLVEFLSARLDEIEATAGQWYDEPIDTAAAERIETYVLADVASKRQIISDYLTAAAVMYAAPASELFSSTDGPVAAYWRALNCVARLLAAPFVDHPDFDPTWAV